MDIINLQTAIALSDDRLEIQSELTLPVEPQSLSAGFKAKTGRVPKGNQRVIPAEMTEQLTPDVFGVTHEQTARRIV